MTDLDIDLYIFCLGKKRDKFRLKKGLSAFPVYIIPSQILNGSIINVVQQPTVKSHGGLTLVQGSFDMYEKIQGLAYVAIEKKVSA